MTSPNSLDLDVVRQCMLRGALTDELDMVATANPVNRVMIVAKALHMAGQACGDMRERLETSQIIDALRREAILRQTGQKVFPASLTSSDADRGALSAKERSHV